MTREELVFLSALRSAANGERLSPDPKLAADGWERVLRLAREQEVLPLIYESVYRLGSFQDFGRAAAKSYRESAAESAVRQITRTNEVLTILLRGQRAGLDPVVVKGAVCRRLYPRPMLRPSVDEDLFFEADRIREYHSFFLSQGLSADEPEADLDSDDEFSYHRENCPTYIEAHKTLFPSGSTAYGELNRLFEGALERTVRVQIQDVNVRALEPTDHLMYLLCHAYKHFLHAGVGIRQICDIGMISREYGSEIDWQAVYRKSCSIRIEFFAAAIFRIGEKYLGFSMPEPFSTLSVDESRLLSDVLSGGALGVKDIDRAHSATITLEAVAADRAGCRGKGLLAAVFPEVSYLSGQYPYLKKFPWLLPVAWGERLGRYLTRRDSELGAAPSRSIRIGRERKELFREYRIID